MGRMILAYTDDDNVGWEIDLGTVISISNTVRKTGMITPIVSQNMQSAFPIESGNSQSYSISFTRKHPLGWKPEDDSREVDSSKWSNAYWYARLTDAVDRWQTRTNGTNLRYINDDHDNIYLPSLNLDGYIKQIDRVYNNNYNEVITGSLDYVVGTMYIGEPKNDGEDYNDIYILMSDAKCENWYVILYVQDTTEKFNCVESFTMTGGVEDPFEHVTIKMPQKKLMEQIPALAEVGGIVNGRNKLYIKGFGEHSMFVQQVETNDSTVTVSAYTDAQKYKASALDVTLVNSPSKIILDILTDPSTGISFQDGGVANSIMRRYRTDLDGVEVTIPAGTLKYRALQICATLLRCRIFFADNKAYIVDYTAPREETEGYTVIGEPFTYTGAKNIDLRDKVSFGRRCIGKTSTDPTGLDPVKNQASMQYSDGTVGVSIPYSIDALEQPLDKGTIKVPELSKELAQTFGENYLTYLCEPQRAMTFTLKEVYSASGVRTKKWESYFGPSAMLDTIADVYTSETVSNLSIKDDGSRATQKLALSTYTRSYPKGTCEYTFGMIASVGLSDNISQTTNTLNVS